MGLLVVTFWWLVACLVVGEAARARLGSGFFRWSVAALFLSPLFAAIVLLAYPIGYERSGREAALPVVAPRAKSDQRRADAIAVLVLIGLLVAGYFGVHVRRLAGKLTRRISPNPSFGIFTQRKPHVRFKRRSDQQLNPQGRAHQH
jgi:hypothetical protein